MRLGVLLTAALAWFAVSSVAQAVNPAPDAGYPNSAVEGENSFNSLTTATDDGANASGTPEPAAFGIIYVVDSTGDGDNVSPVSTDCEDGTGHCTLRAAIEASNGHVGTDLIVFNIPTTDPGFSNGTWIINLPRALPVVSDAVNISGPGAEQLVVQRSSASGTPEFRIFYVSAAGTTNISGLTISNGLLTPDGSAGAGINYTGNGTLNVSKCALNGNFALLGGGIANNTGTLNVNDSTLTFNEAAGPQLGGAGISNDGGTVNVTNSTFSGNDAFGGACEGGGILNRSPGTANVTNSTLSGNSGDDGGGIANYGALTLTKSTLSGNFAAGLGGGIENGGTMTIINSTLNSNSGNQGGGIDDSGTLTITNTTISGNSASTNSAADPGGGGIITRRTTIKSSIVALNTVIASGPDVFGPVASAGFNLVGNTDGSTGFTASTDLTGTTASPLDPRLGPLQDNGGPTLTRALLTGSPAIDKGTSNGLTGTLITDQRGVGYKRVINQSVPNAAGEDGADIGAFELGAHIKAVSRKAYGSVGNFDVSLPLFGPKVGVECRAGGSSRIFQMLMTFPTAVTVSSVSVAPDPKATGATASVSNTSVNGSQVTVNLSGVSNAQRITLTLSGVSDGQNTNDVSVPMGVLFGDTTNNGSVTSNDVTLTQSKIGQTVNGSNFRDDVNHDGAINSNDANLVHSKVGTKLP